MAGVLRPSALLHQLFSRGQLPQVVQGGCPQQVAVYAGRVRLQRRIDLAARPPGSAPPTSGPARPAACPAGSAVLSAGNALILPVVPDSADDSLPVNNRALHRHQGIGERACRHRRHSPAACQPRPLLALYKAVMPSNWSKDLGDRLEAHARIGVAPAHHEVVDLVRHRPLGARRCSDCLALARLRPAEPPAC